MNKLIAILAILIVAFFVYNSQKESEPTAVIERQASAEEQLRALLAQDEVEAEKLAAIVERDPKLAARMLRNRLLNLTGVIESFRVTSTDRKVLRMRVHGTPKTQLCLTFDLKKYNTTSTTYTGSGTYEVVGHEVLYFPGRKEANEGIFRRGTDSKAQEKPAKVLYRAGEKIKQRARFDRIGIGEIHFNAE